MTSPDERRQSTRYDVNLDVSYALLADGTSTPSMSERTKALDISRKGIRVRLNQEVTHDTLIQLCIRLPALRDPILMVGKVRWVQRDGEGFQVGIQFIGHLPPKLEKVVRELSTMQRRRRPGDSASQPVTERS